MKKVTLVTSATLLALTLVGCNNASKDVETTAADQNQAVTDQATIDTAAAQTTEQSAQANMVQTDFITINDAIAAAVAHTAGNVVSVDFDIHDNGTRADYEVKIVTNDQKHEIKVDATNANVIATEQKVLDAKDQAEYQAQQQAQVTLDQAMKAAADSIPGSVITEASFDLEQGQAIYEINLVADNQKHEVKVDANTGSILSTQLD